VMLLRPGRFHVATRLGRLLVRDVAAARPLLCCYAAWSLKRNVMKCLNDDYSRSRYCWLLVLMYCIC